MRPCTVEEVSDYLAHEIDQYIEGAIWKRDAPYVARALHDRAYILPKPAQPVPEWIETAADHLHKGNQRDIGVRMSLAIKPGEAILLAAAILERFAGDVTDA